MLAIPPAGYSLSDGELETPFAPVPSVSYVRSVIPELTNRPMSARAMDARPVIVSRQALKLAAINLVLGAGTMWTAAHMPAPAILDSFSHAAWDVVLTVLLFVPVAAILPLQTLLLTRPLVRDVVQNSVAPGVLKFYAALGVSAGSLLTAVAYGQAISAMCTVA
jgi:hypothetical protein